MQFRTPIDIPAKQPLTISHDDGIVMLGSCFTDNVGALLLRDGFDVVYNPLGPLYNPHSLCSAICLAMQSPSDRRYILREDPEGIWHCLNFASRYQQRDRDALVSTLDSELDALGCKIRSARYLFLTLGTAFVFSLADGQIVGNCHKFTHSTFTRRRLSTDECVDALRAIRELLPQDTRLILTVSPIRHTADSLHGNQLSKATLLQAVDAIVDVTQVHYFPSYEIMMDDLRDYRFYDADMKHPSAVAVEYIYDVFSKYYFTVSTLNTALVARKASMRAAHRPIID